MNQLTEYFENNRANAIDKWMHYFEIYDLYFKKYVNRPVTILEIGVYQGGSLQMWQNYFGKEAKIFAIDINPLCKQFETENIKIFIGSQDDREFLKDVKRQIPELDILIDDGGHTMSQQIVSFDELYSQIKEDGIYLCEDLHTSYWESFGGGYKNPKSFIEFSKKYIDQLNAWYSNSKEFNVDNFTRSSYAMHYYDSILVIEKRKRNKPEAKMTGNIIIPLETFPPSGEKINLLKKIFLKFKYMLK